MTALQMVTSTHFTNKDEKKPKFVQAQEIALYSQNGAGEIFNPLAHKYKGIVNAEKVSQIFNVVGKDYKLLQHDEMYDIIEKTITDMGFNAKITTFQMNEGARLRMLLTFPDIKINIGPQEAGDLINLRIAFDNSYNATTGLRCSVDGIHVKSNAILKISDSLAYYYHKHSKGMDVNNIVPSMAKGMEVFETKVKERWERYYSTRIDPVKAKAFIESLLKPEDGKKPMISAKYLESMLQKMAQGKATVNGLTTQWSLYNLVMNVLTNECLSVDTQESFSNKMDDKINTSISKLI